MSIEPVKEVADLLEELRAGDAKRARLAVDDYSIGDALASCREGMARLRATLVPHERKNYFRRKFRNAVLRFAVVHCRHRPGAGFWFLRHLGEVNREVASLCAEAAAAAAEAAAAAAAAAAGGGGGDGRGGGGGGGGGGVSAARDITDGDGSIRGVALHRPRLLLMAQFRELWPTELQPGFVGDDPARRRGIDPEPRRSDKLQHKKVRMIHYWAAAAMSFRLAGPPYIEALTDYAALHRYWEKCAAVHARIGRIHACRSGKHTTGDHGGLCPGCGVLNVGHEQYVQHDLTSTSALDAKHAVYDDDSYTSSFLLRKARRDVARLLEHTSMLHEDLGSYCTRAHSHVHDVSAALLQRRWKLRRVYAEIVAERGLLAASEARVQSHIKVASLEEGASDLVEQVAATTDLARVWRGWKCRRAVRVMARIRAARRCEECKTALILRSVRTDRSLAGVLAARAQAREARNALWQAEEEARREVSAKAAAKAAAKANKAKGKRLASVAVGDGEGKALMAAHNAEFTVFRYAPMIRARRLALAQCAVRTYVLRYWVVGTKMRTATLRKALREEAALDEWVTHYVCGHSLGVCRETKRPLVCGQTKFYSLREVRKHEAVHAAEDQAMREAHRARLEAAAALKSVEAAELERIAARRRKLLAMADEAAAKLAEAKAMGRRGPSKGIQAKLKAAADEAESQVLRGGVHTIAPRERRAREQKAMADEAAAVRRGAAFTRGKMMKLGMRRRAETEAAVRWAAERWQQKSQAMVERAEANKISEHEWLAQWRAQQLVVREKAAATGQPLPPPPRHTGMLDAAAPPAYQCESGWVEGRLRHSAEVVQQVAARAKPKPKPKQLPPIDPAQGMSPELLEMLSGS